MNRLQMTLSRIELDGAAHLPGGPAGCHGVHVLTGNAAIEGARHTAGDGLFAAGEMRLDGSASLLHFRLADAGTEREAGLGDKVLDASFDFDGDEALIRLDRVSFPPGARAYRHIHPGPGIRVLTVGQLEIASDHDVTVMSAGSAWFEDAFSPVQATAANVPETSFIRMLVLPVEFEGKPTISLLNAADEALPKLQTNTRFFDQRVHLPSFTRSSSDR